MTTRPATPLEVALGPDGDFWSKHGPATPAERQEIERRANSYPRLVEALRKVLVGEFGNVPLDMMERVGGGSYWTSAAKLLRELGEIE